MAPAGSATRGCRGSALAATRHVSSARFAACSPGSIVIRRQSVGVEFRRGPQNTHHRDTRR
eukprot:8718406-Pyramimonas_sp.AAC.1